MALKDDYKDDIFIGKRKYIIIQNEDETVSFDDVTDYEQIGDDFGGNDINVVSKAINEIVNTGTNENGSWIKFSNGSMMCFGTVSKGIQTFTTDYFTTFNRSGTENMRCDFPMSFIEPPDCIVKGYANGAMQAGTTQINPTATQTQGITMISPKGFTSSREVMLSYSAIGKWK